MELEQQIAQFLAGSPHAVVGASTDRTKYGNKVLRAFMQRDRVAFPVNPQATEIESLTAYSSLSDLPEEVHGISIVTPPSVTEQVVELAAELGDTTRLDAAWCRERIGGRAGRTKWDAGDRKWALHLGRSKVPRVRRSRLFCAMLCRLHHGLQ
jgi:predicted CoA-binding protein